VDKLLPTVIVAAIILLALAGMLVGWRARQRRQGAFPPLASAPDDPGAVLASAEGLYVATTAEDQPLERVAVRGLGFRSRMRASATESGIVLALTGQEPVLLPRADLTGADLATWAIDKGVEPGGLVRLRWRWSGTPVDSYLRLDGPSDAFLDAARGLAGDRA
jgi:hypothetical protein